MEIILTFYWVNEEKNYESKDSRRKNECDGHKRVEYQFKSKYRKNFDNPGQSSIHQN